MIKVKKIKGKNLSKDFIRYWNKTMHRTFGEDHPFTPKNKKEFVNDTFFIVKNQNKIVAMSRLRPVKINFQNKKYSILGPADVVSIEKKKGYGKIMMKEMLKEIKKQKKIAISFCERKNDGFYKKCGFYIIKNLVKRFVYINPNGKIIYDTGDDDVFYYPKKNEFMKKVLSNKINVALPMRHW